MTMRMADEVPEQKVVVVIQKKLGSKVEKTLTFTVYGADVQEIHDIAKTAVVDACIKSQDKAKKAK